MPISTPSLSQQALHPSEELLLAVARGQADLPHRVLVEGHLDACASCRALARELQALGGEALEDVPEMPVPPGLWESLKARIEALPQEPPSRRALAGIPLPPGALRELYGVREVRWLGIPRALTGGARFGSLLRDPVTGSALLVGHMPPHRFFPEHVHPGPEDVLVLAGGYADSYGTFEAGTFASYAPGSRHRPLTEPDEECWILVRLEKPNRFTGWRGWLQQLFL